MRIAALFVLLGSASLSAGNSARPAPLACEALSQTNLPGGRVLSSETIPAGATEDVIAIMPSTAPPTTNGFPLYNRQLHLTNGPQSGATPPVGGALTFIHP